MPATNSSSTDSQKKILFVSHAYADMELALLLKATVERSFPDVSAFDASDPTTTQPGEDWVRSVLENLKGTALVVVIATDRSMKRPWVWFEAGASWERTERLVTCAIGRTHKGNLPLPYAIYTALSLTELRDLDTLFRLFSTRFGRATQLPDFDGLAARFGEIEDSIVRYQKALEDPLLEDRWKIVQDTMLNLAPAHQKALELLLLYGSATDYFMASEVKMDHPPGSGNKLTSFLPGLQFTTNLVQPVPNQPAPPAAHEASRVLWEIKPDFHPLVRRYFEEKKAAAGKKASRDAFGSAEPTGIK